MASERPPASRLVRISLCAAVVYHLTAITLANVPPQTALGPGVHAPFAAYRQIFGLWQEWSMFTTVPRFLDIEARVIARDEHGLETTHGVMLPELGDHVDHLRIHAFFVRLTYEQGAFAPQARRYLSAACRAVERRTGRLPRSVQLEVVAQKLRRLDQVRADRRIAETDVERFGEAPCP